MASSCTPAGQGPALAMESDGAPRLVARGRRLPMVVRGSTRAVRRGTVICAVLMIAGLVVLAREAAASPITLIEGTTLGCFGSGCGAFIDGASDSTYGLTFTGVDPFDVF